LSIPLFKIQLILFLNFCIGLLDMQSGLCRKPACFLLLSFTPRLDTMSISTVRYTRLCRVTPPRSCAQIPGSLERRVHSASTDSFHGVHTMTEASEMQVQKLGNRSDLFQMRRSSFPSKCMLIDPLHAFPTNLCIEYSR
jgi:hypothetical protein